MNIKDLITEICNQLDDTDPGQRKSAIIRLLYEQSQMGIVLAEAVQVSGLIDQENCKTIFVAGYAHMTLKMEKTIDEYATKMRCKDITV